MPRPPKRAMLGERGIRMRGHLDAQRCLVGRTNASGPAGTGASPMRPALGALASPAPDRGWIDPEHGGDVNHSMAGIHCGQGSFTDVVRGVRALHRPTVADKHLN